MDIIHFNSDESGFRFMKRTENYFDDVFNKTSEELYNQYVDINEFIGKLQQRIQYPDVVLITSHGANDSLLSVRRGRLVRSMKLHQARLFKHNFIMAIACQTVNEFGPEAIRENAQTYIGFNDFIQCDFEFNSSKNEKFNSILKTIFKKIYQDSFFYSFEKFIKNCLTANEFLQTWEVTFKKSLRKAAKMELKDIRTEFSVPLTEKYETQVKALIKLEFLSKYNTLSNKLILLGDPNYIPWYFIDKLEQHELEKAIEKVDKILDINKYYKHFLKCLIYRSLNKAKEFQISITALEECLSDDTLLFVTPVPITIAN